MTNEELELVIKILNDENTSIEISSEPTIYGYDKIYSEKYTNIDIGYIYTRNYTWEDAYNAYGILGGFACIDLQEILEGVVN